MIHVLEMLAGITLIGLGFLGIIDIFSHPSSKLGEDAMYLGFYSTVAAGGSVVALVGFIL